MARDESKAVPQAVLDAVAGPADIDLVGPVDQAMVESFLAALAEARKKDGDIVLCISTPGGDADLVRRMVLEIERVRAELRGGFYFLGKSVVYSAGVTLMSAFPCPDRFLTRDTILLVHGRQLERTVQLAGPIRTAKFYVEALLREIEIGLELEETGFRRLIDGCNISYEEVLAKGANNWYLTAEEACRKGLVAGLL